MLRQISSGDWGLGDLLCDTWIACDVMSCTASILNLTAISVDRSVLYCLPVLILLIFILSAVAMYRAKRPDYNNNKR